ncbi:hypothetical protein PIROE2DRAFT_15185 [Piromyces sp. E2]|nr:hypothetical protein PIROE2DRAFT_15185 [Piromyces sp. E2]|eukprot:OUM59298.1 hypothetical protein PIROE2DRAFT_15185 [Piromyces sp. E2]
MMLSNSINQSSNTINVLKEQQNSLQKLEKIISTINNDNVTEINNIKKNETNNQKVDKNDTSNEDFSLYQLQKITHMDKYLNESYKLKFNSSKEFNEYQKYKEDLVNKFKNNKIATQSILDNNSLFNSNSNTTTNETTNKIVNSNTFSKENSTTLQDENPNTEPNPDIIVVSNAGDTTVTITESNPPQEKNFFAVNSTKYQTNNINNHGNDFKSYIPISSRSNSELTNTSKPSSQHESIEKSPKENQVEINVSECNIVEGDGIYNDNMKESLLNKQIITTNTKYQEFVKPKSIPNNPNKQCKIIY